MIADYEYELLAFKDVKKVNIFSRLMKSLNYLIWKMFKKPVYFEGIEEVANHFT